MTCRYCGLKQGQEVIFTGEGGCVNCNHTHMFKSHPIVYDKYTYNPSTGAKAHRFLSRKYITCPGCGREIADIFIDCEDDGGQLDLSESLTVALPIFQGGLC